MMRFLFVFMLFFGVFTQASGQGGLDTLGLTGTMADTAVADRLLEEGKRMAVRGEYINAISKLKTARSIYMKLGAVMTPVYRNITYLLATLYQNQSRLDTAVFFYKETVKLEERLTEKSITDFQKTLYGLGVCTYYLGNYDEAIDAFSKIIFIQDTISTKNDRAISNVYLVLGLIYRAKGQYENAIFCSKKALDLQQKILNANDPVIAMSYNNIGLIYFSIGEYDKVIENYNKALEIQYKILGERHVDIAGVYNNIGNVFYSKGDYDDALYYFEKGLEILKNEYEWIHPEIANTLNNIGNIYHRKSLNNDALKYYEASLLIRLKLFEVSHPDVLSSYENIANVFFYNGQLEKAILYYEKVLRLRVEKFGLDHSDVGRTYSNLSNVYFYMGDYKKAIESEIISIDIKKKFYGDFHTEIATSYNNLGNGYAGVFLYEEALNCLTKAVNIQKKAFGDKNPELALTYYNMSQVYTWKREYEKAFSCLDTAKIVLGMYKYDDYSSVKNIDLLIVINEQYALAKLMQFAESKDTRYIESALLYFEEALSALKFEENLIDLQDGGEKISKNKHLIFYRIIEANYTISKLKCLNPQSDLLFNYIEQGKANSLKRHLKESAATRFAGIPDSLLEQEYKLRIDITWREKQRQSLLDKGLTETDTNVLRISGIVFDLKQQYETLKKRFETEYPDYYRLKYDLSTVPLAYVQDTLLQKDQALLEYFTGDSSLFLFVVRPDTFLVQEVKRDFPLEAWIDSLRFGLYGYYTTDKSQRTDSLRDAALNSYIRYAQLLQQKLIAPVAAWLPEKVILVPDGPLGYIPFDALLSAEPEDRNNFKSYPYLLQKHQFSYTYSATLLREMRDKKHRREPQYDFAAFAPFYNGDTTLLAGMYAYDDLMRKDLQPLAFSGPEVAAAAKLMKGETIAGPAATEERFTSTAGNYRILHLATHGRADNRVGDYAFLAFNEIKDSIENELLYVKDLYNLQLNADLVVLSACETGIGKLQRGEGIISLARAFAYAGAKSIVTSLWSVNDKSTSELMRFFYRELRRGKDKDEALRMARQRLIRETTVRNSHPFFWAAFVPLGDMRGVK